MTTALLFAVCKDVNLHESRSHPGRFSLQVTFAPLLVARNGSDGEVDTTRRVRAYNALPHATQDNDGVLKRLSALVALSGQPMARSTVGLLLPCFADTSFDYNTRILFEFHAQLVDQCMWLEGQRMMERWWDWTPVSPVVAGTLLRGGVL
jgi:hypothetical protein